jgi:uncharacterized protein YndB with AHSA1/START domain
MNKDLTAKADIDIAVPSSEVWNALVDPEAVREYMFGTKVSSDFRAGSPITWKGEWKGKPYEDKGEILKAEPGHRLQYSHFSPLAGEPDKPDNYHTVTIELSADGLSTHVSLTQDKNASEEARRHSEENWKMMLSGLKKYVEH